jgi:hypothetical protein
MTSVEAPLAASAMTWIFILIPLLIIAAIALFDIFRRDLPRPAKATWAIIVLLLPVIGSLAYFLMRKPTQDEVAHARDASNEPRTPLHGIEDRRPPVE